MRDERNYWFTRDEEPKDEKLLGCLYGASAALFLFVAMLLCLLFSGCKSVKYVPVIEHHTDTIQITKQQRDSIWLHDSIYVSEKQKGDTIYMWQERWHTKYIEKIKTDTIYEHKVDSVGVPYPVEVKVEKQLNWWQKFRLTLGDTALIALFGLLLYGGWKIYRKFSL